ncbi:isochorismatase family protein [Streptosporangium sp. NBC_01755]|uniref:isochorismatase family protein n=1 Tax=unclassified Streptosporangium TaxID=2632669 RepID=UPI002DDB7609|nr:MULTISPECIES: isochorismatase family protein [unclassified Streptosporangium]WSA24963.1 isochorismatase family protein [Streptosporangium sp. NBC_01810]WSD03705.1 isochorismatase family protein [Streptosporangium sp. NBC_01755]
MALPQIASYPLPGEGDLPENRVAWRPDPRRAILLVHDMQNYFLAPFAAGASPLTGLIDNIGLLREACAGLGVPVVYSMQPGGQSSHQRGLLQDFWGSGIPGSQESEIVASLLPAAADILLTKWRYSAFCRTDLRARMDAMGRDQIIVCGVYAHIGCLMTACDAFMQDLQPFLVADAVADFSWEHHTMALAYAAQRCAVTAVTRGLLRGWDPARQAAEMVGGG